MSLFVDSGSRHGRRGVAATGDREARALIGGGTIAPIVFAFLRQAMKSDRQGD
ncbi:hypothetical protein [Rhodovulum sp. PH10]|uniref:hypothetical protein n=1 Tax=Rhodovulum sp. PH10 TaxID=1187851 RepID=UPI0002FEC79A|nr:hypothetical protein [Rhodovulum sp. PH10]